MNAKHDEQILDAFLEEMLSGQNPPDLTERIKLAWQAEKLRQRPPAFPCEDAVTANPKIAPPTFEPHLPLQVATRKPIKLEPIKQRHRPARRSVLVPALLSVSAAGLLILLGWRFLPSSASPQADNASKASLTERDAALVDTSSQSVKETAGPALANSGMAESSPSNDREATEVLSLDDLPFGSGNGDVASAPQATMEADRARALNSREVVANLNRQLSSLWTDVGVEPTPALAPEQIAARLRSRLAGIASPMDLAVAQPTVPANSRIAKNELLAQIVDMPEAAQRLAERFVQNWFANSRLPLDSPRLAALRRGLAVQIRQGAQWNAVAGELIGGKVEEGSPAETFLAAHAGGGNHRLWEQIGSNFLNVNAACIRCHDADRFNGSSLGEAEYVGSQEQLASQEAYWSMLAMLQGIDSTAAQSGERRIVDMQQELFANDPPLVFYEVIDGRMKAASPRLPGQPAVVASGASGELQVSPRSQLADWVTQSQRFDEATVNQVWEMLLGRPLTPQVTAIEPIAVSERSQILKDLATQFRANGRDVRLLVKWIAGSDAFARSTLAIDPQQWLVATDEALEQRKLAELIFAAGPTSKLGEPRSLPEAMLAIGNWRRETSGSADVATLAQPAPAVPEKNRSRDRERDAVDRQPPVDFVVHGLRPTVAQQRFVEHLMNSKRLSWEQRVDHLVALRGHSKASDRVQQLAKDLLQRHSGDAKAALFDLLWAVDVAIDG